MSEQPKNRFQQIVDAESARARTDLALDGYEDSPPDAAVGDPPPLQGNPPTEHDLLVGRAPARNVIERVRVGALSQMPVQRVPYQPPPLRPPPPAIERPRQGAVKRFFSAVAEAFRRLP